MSVRRFAEFAWKIRILKGMLFTVVLGVVAILTKVYGA